MNDGAPSAMPGDHGEVDEEVGAARPRLLASNAAPRQNRFSGNREQPRVFRQSLPARAWWVFEWYGQPVRG